MKRLWGGEGTLEREQKTEKSQRQRYFKYI